MNLLAYQAAIAGWAAIALLLGVSSALPAFADAVPVKLKISAPGPRNLSFLPIDLISKIGADRAEGAIVQVRYVDGGSSALEDLSLRNVDFALTGAPAILSQMSNGQRSLLIAAINDLPIFVLLVRADLRKYIKSVADLDGKLVGVTTSSLTSKTASQQLAELIFSVEGLPLDRVRIMPVGQSWNEQSSVLAAGTVDAVMSFEPVATRLQKEKLAFTLLNLADPRVSARIPGSGFLLGALATRPDVAEKSPRKAEMMVAILRRTLQWIASHSPEQIISALEVKDPGERAALLIALEKNKRLYSPDGRLSQKQLQETEYFFHKANEGNPSAEKTRLDALVDDRWSGRKE